MKLSCYHCQEPITDDKVFYQPILGEPRAMCCPGCQAVAAAIVDGGMEDYYRFRSDKADKANIEQLNDLDGLAVFDDQAVSDEFVYSAGDVAQISLSIDGIHCAACGWLIERQLARMPGVEQVAVNVLARRASVRWQASEVKLSTILAAINRLGYHAQPFKQDTHEAGFERENKALLRRLGLSGLLTMQLMMIAVALYFGLFGNIETQTQAYLHWVSLLLCTPVVFFGASPFFQGLARGVSQRRMNMDVPISLAVIGLYAKSAISTYSGNGQVYFESVAMFVFLLLASRFIEQRARYRASQICGNLQQHLVQTAHRLGQHGGYQEVLASTLQPGDTIRILSGERIAVDASIISGEGEIDESALSGEFMPQTKGVGDKVYGGTLCSVGSLVLRVDKPIKDSLISEIIRIQELAFASKPRIAQLADRLSGQLVLLILVSALAGLLYWWPTSADMGFEVAMAVLVAMCPCALGLATPTAYTSAVAWLNARGLLVKQASSLGVLTEIDTLVLDKTGTLTEGHFSLARWVNCSDWPEPRIRALAAGMEDHSEHPIAQAFTYQRRADVSDVKILPGQGLSAKWQGTTYFLGNARLVAHLDTSAYADANVFLADDKALLAAFYLRDGLRDDVVHTLACLPANLSIQLLSGDNEVSVREVAKATGIQSYISGATPAAKLAHIDDLAARGHSVLMVGDGINDGPVMAKAHCSLAIGGAADVARNAADIVQLNGQFAALADLINMARRSDAKVKQNLLWALGYNLTALPLALSGILSPWMGVIGMSLSSLLVVANSLTLLRQNNGGPRQWK